MKRTTTELFFKTLFSICIFFTMSLSNAYSFSLSQADVDSLSCSENKDLSIHGNTVLDCYDMNNNLVEQKIVGIPISSNLVENKHKPYMIETKNGHRTSYSLIGKYIENKPFMGFFLNQNAIENEWTMVDFYENGKLINQFCNDIYDGVLDELNGIENSTDKVDYYDDGLSVKNIFEDGVLVDGIEIAPDNKREKGVFAQKVSYVKNKKIDHIVVGVFAVHFASAIVFQMIDNGFIYNYGEKDRKIRVSYKENGRKFEFLNFKNEILKTVDTQYSDILNLKKIESNTLYCFFKKNNTIFYEEVLSKSSIEDVDPLGMIESKTRTNFSCFNFKPEDILSYLQEDHISTDENNLGSYSTDGTIPRGVLYKKEGNTYSMTTAEPVYDNNYNKENSYSINVKINTTYNLTIDDVVRLYNIYKQPKIKNETTNEE